MNSNKNYASLIIWIATLMLISSILGILTKNSVVTTWYINLNRSSLTPPNYIFSIVWSILYVMIAISGWMLWNSSSQPELKSIKKLYIVQLILNWSWTILFFNYHLTGIALICLIAIIILVALILIKSFKTIQAPSILLIPYFLWLLFAAYLNFYMWQNN